MFINIYIHIQPTKRGAYPVTFNLLVVWKILENVQFGNRVVLEENIRIGEGWGWWWGGLGGGGGGEANERP